MLLRSKLLIFSEHNLRSRKPKLTTVGDSFRWPRDALYLLKLVLTSPTSGGRSVGIVPWGTKAPEIFSEHNLYAQGIKHNNHR
jgi:hypothetical protein